MGSGGRERRGPEMARIVERNIAALLAHRREADRHKGWQERVADAITAFAGSMTFVWIHVALFGGWIAVNLELTPLPAFDPTFVVLAMAASVEAIFLSTFVLISQNRMAALADQRADLDLQVSLLSEHEITRLVRMVKAIGDKLGVDESQSAELQELERDVQPEAVLETMEHTRRRMEREQRTDRDRRTGPDPGAQPGAANEE